MFFLPCASSFERWLVTMAYLSEVVNHSSGLAELEVSALPIKQSCADCAGWSLIEGQKYLGRRILKSWARRSILYNGVLREK